MAENHGFFLFFLLLPKVLLLPSVTLAKNCEHEPSVINRHNLDLDSGYA